MCFWFWIDHNPDELIDDVHRVPADHCLDSHTDTHKDGHHREHQGYDWHDLH